ncbi:5612_t:CDS:2 [Ambispora gerdemannii]|uniref:5612_t:CDS:1 n=1 Tax=Ambispora gerdemannii TaxID=144530 RepID=A0A9N8ZI50_9GLOM|nr:5612_t:CDS:2 [Ambispora gerdemannii]
MTFLRGVRQLSLPSHQLKTYVLCPKKHLQFRNYSNNNSLEQDTNTKTASSSDSWRFLFEDVLTKKDIEEEPHRIQRTTPQAAPPASSKPAKRQLSPEEKETFRKIFATLFEKPKAPTEPSKNVVKPDIEFDEPKKDMAPTKPDDGMSTIEQISFNSFKSERKDSGWLSDHFESVPSMSSLSSPSLGIKKHETSPEEQVAITDIRDEITSQCTNNQRLRQFILDRIFKDTSKSKFDPHYSILLEETIALSRTVFYDPYMVLSIFEQAKRQGVESYIKGVSTKVYNEVLRTRWDFWRDIYGMEKLINEMRLNGVQFDEDTRNLLNTVSKNMESGWGPEEKQTLGKMKDIVTGLETSFFTSLTSNP